MKKKILGGLLLSSAIVLPLSVVALSWSTDQKVKQEQSKQELKYVGNQIISNQSDETENGKERLNKIANTVILDYPNKQDIVAEFVDINKITSSGYDKNRFYIDIIRSFAKDEDDTKAEVTFTIMDKVTFEKSDEIRKLIEGFKNTAVDTEQQNEVARKVNFDYPNKENILSSDANVNMAVISGYDSDAYDVRISSFVSDEDKSLVNVTYHVVNKKSRSTSISFVKQINGFMQPKITKEAVNKVADKIRVDYKNKSETPAIEANQDGFVFSGYDESKFHISITSIRADRDEGKVIVSFKIDFLEDVRKFSDIKQLTISGFKTPGFTTSQLAELAKNVRFNYRNRSNVYPWEANSRNIITLNVPAGTTISDVSITGINAKNSNAVITFKISSNQNPSIYLYSGAELSGFRTPSKTNSNLTRTLLDNENGFFNFSQNDRTLMLYRELAKTNPEVTFDFAAGRILIPNQGKIINISKQDTYTVVGSMTETYKKLHEKVETEVSKLINDTFGSNNTIFSLIFKIIGLPKEEAEKEFKRNRRILSTFSGRSDRNTQFYRNYHTYLEALIQRENSTIFYNPKTGVFGMQSGEREIDVNNSRTYIEFMKINSNIKDRINSKIREVFRNEGFDTALISTFLNDRNSVSLFLLQKDSRHGIRTGLKIKQTSRRRG